jgi:hypothetical protein
MIYVIFSHLAGVDVLVQTVSITERGAGGVFVDSHVHTVFVFLQHLWLIWGPIEILDDGDEVGAGAPPPRPTTPLQTSRPVVQIASPVRFSSHFCYLNILILYRCK